MPVNTAGYLYTFTGSAAAFVGVLSDTYQLEEICSQNELAKLFRASM